MVVRFLVGFVCLNLQFSVLWLVDFQWGSCDSIFSFLLHGWQTFSWVRVAQSLVFCVMVGRLLVGFVWLNLQFSVSWLVNFQWGSCSSIFSFLCHGWQIFSGLRVSQSFVFCVMVGRLLVGFVWLNLQFSVARLVDFQWGSCGSIFMFSVSWLVDFQWGQCGSIFSFLCHGWQTFSEVRVAQCFVFCVIVGRLLVGFVWLNLQFSVSWLVDFQWALCGSIFRFLCHGRYTFSGVRVAQSFVFCVMVGRLLVGFVWLNLQFSVSWQVDFQWGSCGSIFSFLCHGRQTFSGVRVAQSLAFCVMVGKFLVGFVGLNLQFFVSWLVVFQWASCGSIFRFLCHGRYTFSGVPVAQSFVFFVMVGRLLVGFVWLNLVFCLMVGRLLVGFVWLNLQFSVSWLLDFQWASCVSIFSFLCYGWQTFSGVRVTQSLVFCCMVGRLLVGFVWLNLQFSVSWQVDFQWALCGSIFRFLCHGRYTFSGVRVAQSFVFCVMVGRLLVGFVWLNLQFSVSWQVDFQWALCGSIFRFLCHGRYTFSGVRVAQSFVFCVMVGRLLVGFVWLNLQFSVSWQVDFQLGSCGSIFSFRCHGRQTFSGVRVAQSLAFCVMVGKFLVGFVGLNLQFFVSWLVVFQWASCGSIFRFLCHGRYTFSGVPVAQSFVFCVMVGRLLVGFVWLNLVFCLMVGRLLVGFVWLNLQFSVSWLLDFQWASCVSIFSFLCYGWQTFSGVRVTQSLVFCCMVGRLLVGFVWLNLQFSVSWQVDFQWGSCGSIFSFLCHGWSIFSGVRVAQSLVFCVMVGRFLVGFVCLNLLFSVLWLVDFQWGSCGSIFSFLLQGWQTFSGVRVAQSLCFLCHGWQTFSGVSVAQSLVFCVMVGRLLVRFVWLNVLFFVSSLVDFQWGSCGSIFSFLCHGWQTFSGLCVAQSLDFCVMVGILLVGFVWLNLLFFVSWLVDFQWGSCGSIFSFLCHGRQTFSGVRVAQSLVFCVMVGRLLVGFVWLNLQLSVSWLVNFQWGSCGSIFSFLCHGWQSFSGLRVAQSLDFCVMVGILLVGFLWPNLLFSVSWLVDFQWGSCGSIQFSVSWLVDFQWGSCGSIFSFLCHGWQTFSGVRVAQSLVFCVMVGRLLVGFVWLNLQLSVSWLVNFQWGLCGSIFSFLCHGRQTFSRLRVSQSLVFCVIVGRLLVGFLWPNLLFSVSWLVDLQWGSCGSIFSFLCHGWQTFSGLRVAQTLIFCVMVGRLLVGFVWLNLQFSVSWLVDFQWGSCGSIFSFMCHGRQTFSGVLVTHSLVFCVMVGRLLVGFVWLNLQFSVSWLVNFQWGSCGSIFSFLCHGWQIFSGLRVSQSLVFCVMVGRLLVGFVWLNLQFSVAWLVDFQGGSCGSIFMFSVSWLVDFQWGSCGSIFSFLCHGWQTFSGVRVAQSLVFCVMVGSLLVGFVWLNLQISVSWQVYFQWGSCGPIFCFLCHGWQTFSGVRVAQSSFLSHGWQTFSGVRVAQSLVFCVMVGRLLVGFVWLNLQFSVSWQVDFQWGSCGSIFSFLCHGW